jgi:hypothetical protein
MGAAFFKEKAPYGGGSTFAVEEGRTRTGWAFGDCEQKHGPFRAERKRAGFPLGTSGKHKRPQPGLRSGALGEAGDGGGFGVVDVEDGQ